MTDTRVPVTLLTGFLGAGKTTLLRRLLRELGGERVVVIENEFGAANIDSDIVEEIAPGMVRRLNGCICCAVQHDLTHTFVSLADAADGVGEVEIAFDRVLLETTGMAEPGAILETFFAGDRVQARFRVDAVVTVVDARHIGVDLENSPNAQSQVALADVILLNKIDLVDGARLDEVEAAVVAVNPLARRYRTRMADCPAQTLLDLGAFEESRLPADGHRHAHDHGEFGSVLLVDEGPHDIRRVRAWLRRCVRMLGDDLVRYKGVVHAAGGQRRVSVQGVRDLFTVETLRAWRPDEAPRTTFVLIGLHLPEDELRAGLLATRRSR